MESILGVDEATLLESQDWARENREFKFPPDSSMDAITSCE
jgi:hypothetical protein